MTLGGGYKTQITISFNLGFLKVIAVPLVGDAGILALPVFQECHR